MAIHAVAEAIHSVAGAVSVFCRAVRKLAIRDAIRRVLWLARGDLAVRTRRHAAWSRVGVLVLVLVLVLAVVLLLMVPLLQVHRVHRRQ